MGAFKFWVWGLGLRVAVARRVGASLLGFRDFGGFVELFRLWGL